ncbi:MAG TPA: FAD-binding oxidoreductase [Rhizomicrobium sp.]|nr:FAD-binding oxidoreductase [Rhizomicrobium sp.]
MHRRRRPRRPDGGTRGGAARLVGRRAGGGPGGLERLRRNCGFVMPGFAAAIERIVERVGLDHAKALWKLSEQGVAYVREAIRETGMPGVVTVDGCLDVSTTDDSDEFLDVLALLGQEFEVDVEGWTVERVRAVLKTEHYFHALHYPGAFHLHPLYYAHGLAASAEQHGARIFEETPVLEIDPAGVRKRVATPAARVRAAHVVLAGNTLFGGLVPRLAETVLPVTSYVAVTAPLGERLAQAVAWPGGVSEGRFVHQRCRIVDGDRLMWAGGASLWPNQPGKVARRFARDLVRRYPQLGEVEIAHVWSGVTGTAVHRMPQVGEMSPGIWIAGAFAGHGLNTTAMAGDLIARAIIEGDDRWRLFIPYELVWAGGTAGRTLTQVSYWSRRLRDAVAASAARRREVLRRKETTEG